MKFLIPILLLASFCAGAPAPNARERQNTPLWINVPVPPAALASIIPAPLVADTYQGNAYINILTYSLDKLEFYTWFGFVDTFTKGWVTKITVFVYDPVREKHGYLITSIDFQNNLSGWIRSAGAMLQQKIPSHVCSFNSDYNTASQQISFDFKCDKDGFKGSSAFVKGSGKGVDNAFVNWVAVRNTKYLKQNDGSVVYADVTYPGIEAGLNDWYPLQGSSTWTTNLFSSRLGLPDNYPICQQPGQCFWASYYGIIDHVNTRITSVNSNSVSLDGTFVDTTDVAMSSTSNSSNNTNNMIWLYGILIGVGLAVLIGSMVFLVVRYHGRGKHTVQHLETSSS